MRFFDLNVLMPAEQGQAGQPGLSACVDKKWLHGAAAFAVSREDPQALRTDVWENLSLDPVKLPGGMRHLADLAVGQLQTLCRDLSRDVWTVFTPVHWDREQLRVFLGVAEACQMDVRALLPRVLTLPVSAGTQLQEWQWNQCFEVKVIEESEGLTVKSPQSKSGGGVLDLFRHQARAAARWMLETHRLDPMHSGKTEQQLFESWWRWQQGQGDWECHAGGLSLSLAGVEGVPAEPAGLLSPPGDVSERLGDLSQPGARYKSVMPVTGA